MGKKVKILFLLIFSYFFCIQYISYSSAHEKSYSFYKEKLSALEISALLAEKQGNAEDIETQYELLLKACKEAETESTLPEGLKRKAQTRLIEAKFKLGKDEEALQLCDELLQLKPIDKSVLKLKAEIYQEKAKDFVKEGNYISAIELYEEVTTWDMTPDLNAFFKNLVANTYLQKGDYEQAIFWCQKIKDEHSELLNWPACATNFMALAYRLKGDIDKAKELYQEIITNYPQSAWVNCASKQLEILDKND